jgi:hypothetical protein
MMIEMPEVHARNVVHDHARATEVIGRRTEGREKVGDGTRGDC